MSHSTDIILEPSTTAVTFTGGASSQVTVTHAITEVTLEDGSTTQLISGVVIDNRLYYDLAFAAAQEYTDELFNSTDTQIGGITTELSNVSIELSNTNTTLSTVSNTLSTTITELGLVSGLAETNAFKISQLEEGFDTLEQTVDDNFASLSASKADKSAFETLQDLVDTKATPADITAAIAALVDGSPSALNTLNEIATALQGDEATIATILTGLNNRVRFDAAQSLTTPQQDQARSNINAEKVGVAATLVAGVTPGSIGAATSTQGAKADSALQSGDVAPVALSGLFSSLTGKSALFNLVYSAYTIGSNVAIAATDTLGEMLGKLQAQVNAKEPAVAVDLVTKFWSGTKTWRDLATDVRDVVLTGLSTSTATAVTATDKLLVGIGKLQAQINDIQSGTSLFTSLPAANSVVVGKRYRVSDVGVNGSDWYSNGTNWKPVNGTIVHAIGSSISTTGVATETVNTTVSIPANVLGINGAVEITSLWSCTNNANTKTARIRFNNAASIGGTAYLGLTLTSLTSAQTYTMVRNKSATNAQIGGLTAGTPFATLGSVLPSGTIDTAATSYIVFSAVPTNSGDTMTLEHYIVKLILA